VSDQDFNFTPPPRREAKKKAFEPPPWERDQFDELARRKDAEQHDEAEQAEEAAVTAALEEASTKAADEAPEATAPTEGLGAEEAGELAGQRLPQPAGALGMDDDPRVEAMLQVLKSEEPPFGTQLWKVSLAAGAVLASVGLVMTVWGFFAIAATARAGALGSLGGGILVAFGLGFVGVGGWMAFRTLRQRGVL
jgi:hypothetical protein